MKYKLILINLLFCSITSSCMEPKGKERLRPQKKIKKDNKKNPWNEVVSLQSNEGATFYVPKHVAFFSRLIKNFSYNNQILPLPYDTNTLAQVIQALVTLSQNRSLEFMHIYKQTGHNLDEALRWMAIADYLNIPLLLKHLTKQFVQSITRKNREFIINKIKSCKLGYPVIKALIDSSPLFLSNNDFGLSNSVNTAFSVKYCMTSTIDLPIVLDLSYKKITTLRDLPKINAIIVIINLSNNEITSIGQDDLKHTNYDNEFDIVGIDLSNNKISDIKPGAFSCLIKQSGDSPFCYHLRLPGQEYVLPSVSVSGNFLTTIDNIFSHPSHQKNPLSFEIIDLSNNQITSITEDSFKNVEYIYYLNLSCNKIHSIDLDSLAKIKIDYINLTGNSLSEQQKRQVKQTLENQGTKVYFSGSPWLIQNSVAKKIAAYFYF